MEDTAELESIIRSLLVSSPKVMKPHRLEADYRETEGRCFPFRKLGFSTFLDYLKSIPHVVKLEPFNSFNPDCLPIVTKAISHIDKLVSKQRTTAPSRKRSSSRRGGCFGGRYNTAPPPRRRPPAYSLPEPRPTPNKGVYVSELESHIKSKYSREDLQNNGIHSINDLLSKAEGMVDCVNNKVFPNLSKTDYPEMMAHVTQPKESSNCIPAGMEEEFEEDSDYDDYNSNNYCDIDNMKYDEAVFDGIEEEAVSNYTIQRCTETLLNSKKNVESTKGSTFDDTTPHPLDDHEANFSEKMIKNFRSILAKYPDGVWATELPQKYFEEFKVTLDIQSFGYTSAVEMASYLPGVFLYKRVGSHDWKLYDALLYSDHVDRLPLEVEETSLKDQFEENYVPKSIVENILQLLDRRPEGIKSVDLLYFYEMEYHKRLDLQTLGFKNLEDFIGNIKDLITVRKATGHYLLLPKHKTVSLDMIKAESEELKLSVDSFEFMGPENVLKPNDVIPPQELPPVNLKNHLEPLMSMVVRLGEVINPGLFYFMLDSKYNELQSMMEDLHQFYKQEEQNYKILLPYVTEGLFCACKYETEWHRAVITGIRKNGIVNIEYIDYGSPGKVHVSELRFLQTDFAKLPSQAICAKLIGLVPKSEKGKWPQEACRRFLDMVLQKRLMADVYRIHTKKNKDERVQLEVILFDTTGKKDVVCNDYLVELGYAEYINSQQDKKEEDISLEQTVSSTNSQQSPAIQTNDIKRPSRIPPGFEADFNSAQVKNQETWMPPNDSSQINNAYIPQPPLQQHWQINNILLAPPFYDDNLRQIGSMLQAPQLFNMRQLQYQGNQPNNGWSQYPFLPPNPNYISNAFPATVQNVCFPNLNSPQNYYQPYVGPAQVNPNITNNTQNMRYQNRNANYGHSKIPGYSADLSMPLQSASPPMFVPPSNYQQRPQQKTIPASTSPVLVEVDQKPVKRSNFPKTQPVPELLPSSSENKSKYEKPQQSLFLDTSEPIKKEVNMKINNFDDIRSNNDKIEPQISIDSQFTTMSTTSIPEPLPTSSNISSNYDKHKKSEYVDNLVPFKKEVNMKINKFDDAKSNKDILETQNLIDSQFLNETDHIPSAVNSYENKEIVELSNNLQSLAFSESTDSVIDNWENLDIDDTPAKADNFSINFKTSIDSIHKDVRNAMSNKCPDVNIPSNTQKKNTGNNLLQSNKLEATTNWKDIFDPDNLGYSERNNTINKINTDFERNSLEKKLIKKLEFNDTFFHLLQVNNKYAVFSEEFFPQFISMKWQVLNKLVELKYKKFDVVSKKTNPELYTELEKIQLCGGINKKWNVKIGKPCISYISEIPSVFSVFNEVPDPDLLLMLKDYEHISTAK